MSETANYIPGMCNIDPKEVLKRRQLGYMGLAATALLLAVFIAFDASWWIRLLIFIPAFTGATGFLQAKNKFCVGFASAHIQNVDTGDKVKVTDQKSLLLDKLKARKMNLQAFGIALIVTLITLVIPSIS